MENPALAFLAASAQAAPLEPVWSLAKKEKPAVVETLRELVNVESAAATRKGLDRLAALLGEKLAALGGKVSFYEPTDADTYRLFDTPKELGKVVTATFQGTGKREVMCSRTWTRCISAARWRSVRSASTALAPMGPGIADDKGGIAVILHTLAMLKAMNYRGYGTLTVVINGDEEISSPGGATTSSAWAPSTRWCSPASPSPGQGRRQDRRRDQRHRPRDADGARQVGARRVAPELGRNADRRARAPDPADQRPFRSGEPHQVQLDAGEAADRRATSFPELATASADVRVNRLSDLDVIEGASASG
jgi:glutamate carboxypeptidase